MKNLNTRGPLEVDEDRQLVEDGIGHELQLNG